MPAVNHSFVNPKADSADTTIARPSDWNAAHAVDWGETGDIVTQDYSDTPAGGALDEIARADHRHGMPTAGNGLGYLNVMDPPYNAVGNGVANDTAAIQDAIDDGAVDGRIVFLPAGTYKVTTLNLDQRGTSLLGVMRDTSGVLGTYIAGTATYPILSFPTATTGANIGSDYHISNMQLDGGLDSVQSLTVATHAYFDNVSLVSPSRSAVYIEGAIEEWYFRNCSLVGGTNTVWIVDEPWASDDFPLVFVGYIDKSSFQNCHFSGATGNLVRIESERYDVVNFIDCVFSSSGQHGVYVDSGGPGLMFINAVSEGNGNTGKKARTTSTVGASSTACTLASASGFANGDPITIAGAGLYGVDHTTTIAALAGTAATLAVAAVTAVTAAKTTNASWDDFHFADTGAPTDTIFVGGVIGGEGAGGKLRYALRAAGPTTAVGLRTFNVPLYDPYHLLSMIGGTNVFVRQPNSHILDWYEGAKLSVDQGSTGEYSRNLVPSAAGGDLVLALRSLYHDQTTFGNLEVRKGNSNHTTLFQLSGADGTAFFAGYIEMDEVSAPTGTANRAKLFTRDNGSGKTQICAIFGSGAVQVIATEP